MEYVHYDPEKVRRTVIELADRNRDLALAEAKDDLAKSYVQAQHALSVAHAEAVLQNVRMLGEGRAPEFIGGVMGAFIGTLAANVTANNPDPQACLKAMQEVFAKSLLNGLGVKSPDFTSSGAVEIHGERGGRA